jgi:hypothetical protein
MSRPNDLDRPAPARTERHLRVDRWGLHEEGGARRAWLLRSALYPIFGAPCPAMSAAEPASTEKSGALDLPPRTQLLQPSGPSQLVNLADQRLHFLFVA